MYCNLLLYNKVRLLFRGEVLKSFVVCLKEVKIFLDSKRLNHYQLKQVEWLEKLHFIADMTAHVNTIFQGRVRTALYMLEDVLAFEQSFTVFARNLQRRTLSVVAVVVTQPLPRDGGMAEDHGAPEPGNSPGSGPEVV